jgi:hypothetical protein
LNVHFGPTLKKLKLAGWFASHWLYLIAPTAPGTNVSHYLPGGGADLYSGYHSTTGQFAHAEDDASVLVLEKKRPDTYRRFLNDGSTKTYAESDGSTVFPRRIFLTTITDPQGNALTLNYDRVGGRTRLGSPTRSAAARNWPMTPATASARSPT